MTTFDEIQPKHTTTCLIHTLASGPEDLDALAFDRDACDCGALARRDAAILYAANAFERDGGVSARGTPTVGQRSAGGQHTSGHPVGRLPLNRPVVALCGSLALVVGVFAPVFSFPLVGTVNFFQNGNGDGVILLVVAGASIGVTLARRYRWLWLTGVASLSVLAVTFVRFQQRMSEMRAGMERDLAGNPFRGVADAAVNAVQMQWGWGPLLIGALLLLIAAGSREAG